MAATKEEALQKAAVLTEIIENSITEFNKLNTEFDLRLSLGDNSMVYGLATDIAYDQGWSTSNC